MVSPRLEQSSQCGTHDNFLARLAACRLASPADVLWPGGSALQVRRCTAKLPSPGHSESIQVAPSQRSKDAWSWRTAVTQTWHCWASAQACSGLDCLTARPLHGRLQAGQCASVIGMPRWAAVATTTPLCRGAEQVRTCTRPRGHRCAAKVECPAFPWWGMLKVGGATSVTASSIGDIWCPFLGHCTHLRLRMWGSVHFPLSFQASHSSSSRAGKLGTQTLHA